MALVAYTETINTSKVHSYRSGARQKPFLDPNLEIPYTRYIYSLVSKEVWGSPPGFDPEVAWGRQDSRAVAVTTIYDAVFGSTSANGVVSAAYNRAYNKLLSKTGERASLLTALAERQSTFSMVVNRLHQLYKGAKALRRGRFREFLRIFGLKAKDKHRDTQWARPRDFSSLWLEYWFGWAPTIGDISNAVDVWQRPIEPLDIRVGAGSREYSHTTSRDTSTYNSTTSVTGKFFLQLRCKIDVVNPDLWVANQMGFINPVRTAWELVPFSWFADWFTNIGQVLGSFTDLIGVKILDPWCSRFFKGNTTTDLYFKGSSAKSGGCKMERNLAFTSRVKLSKLPRPTLTLQVPKLSWTRGLTLSSLIVQLFSPPGRKA